LYSSSVAILAQGSNQGTEPPGRRHGATGAEGREGRCFGLFVFIYNMF